MESKKPTKAYIGDGVYASHDGWQIELSTERGDGKGTHVIYLEPDVMQSLVHYAKKHMGELKA